MVWLRTAALAGLYLTMMLARFIHTKLVRLAEATNGSLNISTAPKTSYAELQPLLVLTAESQASAAAYFEQLRRRVDHELHQRSKTGAINVLKAGIYCLESFVQLNVCGYVFHQA